MANRIKEQRDSRTSRYRRRQEIAVIWGELMGAADRAGRPRSAADARIAATAISHDLAVATRNTRGFQDMNVDLLNPWK